MPVATAASSVAGIITAGASIITALALLIGSFTILLPLIRRTAAATEAVKDTLAEATAVTDRKLDQIDAQARRIHTLVNSDMTAARQSELDQTRATLVISRRIVALARAGGDKPLTEDTDAIGRLESRVTELEQILADRLHQARIVEAEAARSGPLPGES